MIDKLVLLDLLKEENNSEEVKKYLIIMIDELLSNKNLAYKLKRIKYIKDLIPNADNLLIKEFLFEIIHLYLSFYNEKIPDLFDKKLISYYINNRDKLHIYNIKRFEIENWTINDVVIDSVRLSAKLVNNYSIDNKDIDYWINIRKKNKDLYLALVLSGIIIGHIGSIPIDYNEYKFFKKGILEETEFKYKITDIQKIEYLYIPTIVIEKNFRKVHILKNLLINFFNLIRKLENLKKIIVNAYSTSGEKLSERLGFEFIGHHSDGGKIYELDLQKANKRGLFLFKKISY